MPAEPTPTPTPAPPTPTPATVLPTGTYEISRAAVSEAVVDPWVVQLADRYVMFYCKNSWQAGPYFPSPDVHDRVWRAESRDGIINWTDAHAVVEGVHSAQDDLSCSPGVVIAPDGTWHMYYMTASRDTMCVVEMWHATSPAPGLTWTKLGKVAAVQTSDCSLLQPSPAIENGKIAVYFVVDWAGATRLWRMESSDGHAFTIPTPVGSVPESCNARPGAGHLVYSSNAGGGCATQTTEMHLSDGLTPGPVILSVQPGTGFSMAVSAGNYLPGPPARVYFTGNYTFPAPPPDYPNNLSVIVVGPPAPPPAGSCIEDSLTLCLVGSRYKITSRWKNQYTDGALSDLHKTRVNDRFGAFWVSDSAAYEYIIQIQTATDNGHAWIAIAAFTDVEFFMTVTDTVSGQIGEYHGPPGKHPFIYDPSSFVYP